MPSFSGHASLFQRVMAASGLSGIFVEGVLRRACARASINADAMTTDGLRRALPFIEDSLRVYLDPSEVDRRIAAIRKLAEA